MGRPLSSLMPEAKKAKEMIESLEDASAKAVDQDIKAHAKVWSNKTDHERQISISQADAGPQGSPGTALSAQLASLRGCYRAPP